MDAPSRGYSDQPPTLDSLEKVLRPFPVDADAPYLFLMSGLPGSGKTTVAQQLATRYRALLLSLDEFLVSLFGPSHIIESPSARIQRVTAIREPLWAIARRALNLNISVILDDGFFTRESRAAALHLCTPPDSCRPPEMTVSPPHPIIVYCAAPGHLLNKRLAERSNRPAPDSHHISPDLLASFTARFQPPCFDEGIEIVEVSSSSDDGSRKPLNCSNINSLNKEEAR